MQQLLIKIWIQTSKLNSNDLWWNTHCVTHLDFQQKKSKVIYQLELTHKKYTISIKNIKVTHIHVKIFILLLVNNKNIFLYEALYLIINS